MLGSLRLMAIVVVTLIAAPAAAECVLPDSPEIPEGRTAGKDQMVAASKAIKVYQTGLVEYRTCIDGQVAALGEEPEASAKEVLTALYDDSIDLEEALATRFNSQVRDFKAAQK